MPCDASAMARADARSESVTRASAVTCWLICSTVPSSGRRSSAMWMAVAIWLPSVLSAVRSLVP